MVKHTFNPSTQGTELSVCLRPALSTESVQGRETLPGAVAGEGVKIKNIFLKLSQ